MGAQKTEEAEKACHPERLKKIYDFRKESKDLGTNLTANVNEMRRSFDSLRIFYCMIATGDHYIQIRLRYAQDDSTVRYLHCTTVGRGQAPRPTMAYVFITPDGKKTEGTQALRCGG